MEGNGAGGGGEGHSDNEYRIVVLGSGATGKSAITVQLCCHHFLDQYDPTIEDSYRTSLVVDGVPVVLDILDTAGQTEYSQLRELYMRAGRGFVLVYAVDNRESFAALPEIYEQILRVWEVETEDGVTVPVVLCGNKCDLPLRQINPDEGTRLATLWNAYYFETSAKTGMNVEAAFFQVIRAIRAMDAKLHPTSQSGRGRKFFSKCSIL